MIQLSLNTSTIADHPQPWFDKIERTGKAGYDGIELWVKDIDAHLQAGGTLAEIKAQCKKANLTIVNLIAFFNWLDNDETKRQKGLEEAQRIFQMAKALGCPYVAAPPFGYKGPKGTPSLQLRVLRYRALLDLARSIQGEGLEGPWPLLEFWGHVDNLGTQAEALALLQELQDPHARVLADLFHHYRRGGEPEGLLLIPPGELAVLHVNDAPPNIPLNQLKDQDRVYPGEGVIDQNKVCQTLRAQHFEGWISLELFNPEYGQRPLDLVLEEGLRSLRHFYK